MPPPQLTNELAVGHRSPGRIANGLLVPLFPTLFAQLTAIAKEFSLPSTTGLCLYLHIPDAPATPRITDDVWPLLWSRHFHTDDSALPLGLPVAGRVEFDIDIPNARWYPMWFAHVSRQELVPDLARTIPPSPRGPGRDLSPNESTRAAKSVPRPLTLVPRDEPVVQVDSTPSPAPSSSRPSIPKSASKETVEKVRRWSALVTPDPALRVDTLPAAPAAVEEISVPPSTDETPVPLSTEASPEDEPLNLEDFQWSISSAGPPSPTSSRATSASSRVVSIHILERNEGSVLLTPTTATSWGAPSVSDVESDLNLNLGWRVRSPDIGERAEGSVLLTPSTATSWGAPLSYPSTPAQWIAMQEFVRSPDLGERAEGSVLLTPSTATTWGAPLSYPPTPAQWYSMRQYIRSPDAGERAEGSVLLTPSTATTWGAPETYPPTPEAWAAAQRGRVASPDLGARAEVESEFGRGRNSTMVWGAEIETEQEAYARMRLPSVWEFGRPRPEGGAPETVAEEPELDGASRGNQGAEGSAPIVFITREVTETFELRSPRFELAADDTSPEGNSTLGDRDSAEFGVLGSDREQGVGVDTFEHGLPHFEPVPLDEEDEILDAAAHDTFEYDLPHFELVEGEGEDEDEGEGEYDGPDAVTPDTFGYPDFELQASDMHVEHSTFVSSPASIATAKSVALATVTVASTTTTAATQARSYGAYPFLVIYPAMYPHLDLYPAALGVTVARSRPTLNSATRAIRTQVTESTVAAANFQTTGAIKRASTPRPVGSTIPVEFVSSPVESIKTVSSQTEPSVPSPSSRRPSLSVRVPRARSGTIVAVNPAAGRSLAWSRALPPVPPVPPEVLARLAGPENARSVNAPVPSRRLNVGRKPPTVLENTEFEPLSSEKKLVLSSAYPCE
ncbi:hypothetical protein FRC08_013127 [Ceratobasidium sp. 394]|nr:hypothetical protein FRC08_013127 [Ceratobasidium sp. 394]